MGMSVVATAALLGFLLVYFEFFLPGGLLAALGGLSLLLSIVAFAVYSQSFGWTAVYFLGLLICTALVCKLALIRIQRSRNKNTFFLDQDQEGFAASSYDSSLIGAEAVVVSDLKPSGHIEINGERAQALSQSGYIEKGTKVKIISGRGAYYIVSSLQ